VITQPSGVPLLSITATTADADTSAAMANAVAAQLVLEDQQGQVGHYHLQQVSEARPPAQRDSAVGSAGLFGAALLGAVAGGLLGRSIARRWASGAATAAASRALDPSGPTESGRPWTRPSG